MTSNDPLPYRRTVHGPGVAGVTYDPSARAMLHTWSAASYSAAGRLTK
jgi:hypothetical protein